MTAVAALAHSSALAQGTCLPRDIVLRQLDAEYGERPIWHGLTDDGRMLEIIVARDGGTWTAIYSLSNGLSCVVASGATWKPASPPPKERES